MSELRVDFYVIDDAGGNARLSLACKLAEKAYLATQSVLIWHTEPAELKALDEMLWTFRDGSFVPHDIVSTDTAAREAPILLSAGPIPAGDLDLIINLAAGVPDFVAQSKRIIEIIDGDEGRRRAGRARWEAYRKRGVQPASHNL
jgi:DNA polymerase III subunit chi